MKFKEPEWDEYEQQHGKWSDDPREDTVKHVCDKCGELKLCKFVPDPYIAEIEDREVRKWLCHPCYEDIYGDI